MFLSRGTQSTVRSDKSPAYSVRLHLDILPPQALKHLCVPYLRSSRVHRCSHLFSPSKIEPESHAIRASFTTASCSVVISNYDFQEETKQLVVATDGFTWVNVHGKTLRYLHSRFSSNRRETRRSFYSSKPDLLKPGNLCICTEYSVLNTRHLCVPLWLPWCNHILSSPDLSRCFIHARAQRQGCKGRINRMEGISRNETAIMAGQVANKSIG